MKHNAMLKSEFDTKMKQLQDKWAEVESLTIEDQMPGREDVEQMVGLTGKQHVKKSLHEMLKSKTKADYITEEANAKQFIKSIKIQKKDRQKLLDELQKRKEDQEKVLKEEHDKKLKELQEDQTRKREEREQQIQEKMKKREQERKQFKLLSPEIKEITKQKPLYQIKME